MDKFKLSKSFWYMRRDCDAFGRRLTGQLAWDAQLPVHPSDVEVVRSDPGLTLAASVPLPESVVGTPSATAPSSEAGDTADEPIPAGPYVARPIAAIVSEDDDKPAPLPPLAERFVNREQDAALADVLPRAEQEAIDRIDEHARNTAFANNWQIVCSKKKRGATKQLDAAVRAFDRDTVNAVLVAFCEENPKVQEYIRAFGDKAFAHMVKVVARSTRGMRYEIANHRSEFAARVQSGQIDTAFQAVVDSPAWMASFATFMVEVGCHVDKAFEDAPHKRESIFSTAVRSRSVKGFRNMSAAQSAAAVVIAARDSARRKKEAEKAEQPAFKRARDSSQADIEQNPGPALARLFHILGDSVSFPIGDGKKLKVELQQPTTVEDFVPTTSMGEDVKLVEKWEPVPPSPKMVRAKEFVGKFTEECEHTQDELGPFRLKRTWRKIIDSAERRNAVDIIAVFHYFTPLLCLECHSGPRGMLAHLMGQDDIDDDDVDLDDLVESLEGVADITVCTVEAHTVTAVHEHVLQLPARGLASLYSLDITLEDVGFGHPICPICWPHNRGFAAPPEDKIAANQGQLRFPAMHLIYDMYLSSKDIVMPGGCLWIILNDPEVPNLSAYVGSFFPVLCISEEHEDALRELETEEFAICVYPDWAEPCLQTYMATLANYANPRHMNVITEIDVLHRVPPTLCAVPLGTYDVVHDHLCAKVTTHSTYEGFYVHALFQSLMMGGTPGSYSIWLQARIPINWLMVARLPGLTPRFLTRVYGNNAHVAGPPGRYFSLSHPGRMAVMPSVSSLSCDVAIDLLLPPAKPVAGIFGALSLLSLGENLQHAGTEHTIDMADLPWVPPVVPYCGCLQCVLRHHYGPVVIPLCGTRGDRVPFAANARTLKKWGIDILFLHLQTAEAAEEDLRVIHRGEVTRLAKKYSYFAAVVGSLPYITFGPGELKPDVIWGVTAPPDRLNGYVWRTGPLLDPLVSFFSGIQKTQPRVAAYPGRMYLPRSADGTTFLKLSTVKRDARPVEVMWAVGSQKLVVPPGAVEVEPGDHYAQFQRAKVVVTHGGAGTVQTAALAGAQVVVVDPVLDRNYLDLNDAGRGVCDGQDPNRVILMLLGVDFLPMLLAWRTSFSLFVDSLVWYARIYLTSDIVTIVSLFILAYRYSGLVLLPGSVVTSAIGTVFSLVLGRNTAVLAALGLQIWGAAVLAKIGLTELSMLMKILIYGRKLARTTLAGMAWGLGMYKLSAFLYIMTNFGLPMYGTVQEAFGAPRGYLEFVYVDVIIPIPLHVRLTSVDLKTVVEGIAVSGETTELYRLSRRPRTQADDDNTCLRIPTLIDPDKIQVFDQPVAKYFLFMHNCMTTILFATKGQYVLLGAGFIGLIPMLFIAFGLGLVAALIISAFGLLALMGAITVGDEAMSTAVVLRLFVSRFRAIEIIDKLRPNDSFSARVMRASLVLLYAPGLSAQEQEVLSTLVTYNREATLSAQLGTLISDMPKLIDAAIARSASLQTLPHVRLLLSQMVGYEIPPAVRAEVAVHAVDSPLALIIDRHVALRASALNGERLDPLTWAQDAEYLRLDMPLDLAEHHFTARETPLALLLAYWALLANGKPEDFETSVLDGFMPDVQVLVSALARYFSFARQHPGCDVRDVRVAAILADIDEKDKWVLLPYLKAEEGSPAQEDMPVLAGEEELTQTDVNGLAVLSVVASLYNCDDVENVAQAVLNSADTLHDGSAPIVGVENRARADIAAYYDATSGIRDVLGKVLTGVTWLRDKIVKAPGVGQLGLPFHTLFAFIGFAFSLAVMGAIRGVLVAMSMVLKAMGKDDTAVEEFAQQVVFFIQMLDPAHRATPKPVWALLWKRKRANVTKGESLLFSLAHSTYQKPASYGAWVDQMAELMEGANVDTSILHRTPPTRGLYVPADTYGLDIFNTMPIEFETHFTETARERKLLEDSIRAGNGVSIDGAWLAKPDVLVKTLQRYTVPRPAVGARERLALTEAADAMFDRYPELYERPLPMTVAQVLRNSKWKYSAGLPFLPVIRKRETLKQTGWYNAIGLAATRILETGKMPAVGMHAFPKAQVVAAQKLLDDPGLIRSVTAGDRVTATAFNTLLLERNKRVPDIDAGLLNMMARSEGQLTQLKAMLDQFPNWYSGDGKQFDSSVVSEVATVGSVRLYERGVQQFGVYNAKAAVSVVHAYYEALTRGMIVSLMDGTTVWKTGGGGTGSAATTPDNRDWTRLSLIAAWSLAMEKPAHEFFNHVVITNASDDVFIAVSDETNARLLEWRQKMQDAYGVNFTFVRESTLNNILHLVNVPADEVDHKLYAYAGVEPPEVSLRHSPKQLLLRRAAYRSDRMRLDDLVAFNYLADRSAGYQLLCAHSPDMYDLVTTDLVDAHLGYLKFYFKSVNAVVGRSETGLIMSYAMEISDTRPTRYLEKLSRKRARRHNLTEEQRRDYILSCQAAAKRWYKQRRGKSYEEVFRLWVRRPLPPPQGKAGRRWQTISAQAAVFTPLTDLLRIGVVNVSNALSLVPSALTHASPEVARLGVTRPFMTWDFVLEQYVWRREYLRNKKVPSPARMSELFRQAPFSGVMDLTGFECLLRSPDVLRALVYATEHNKSAKGAIWAVSNDAITGRVFAILIWYTLVDVIIRAFERRAFVGILVIGVFSAFRWLDTFYSLQSLAYWVCVGAASLAISNTVPRDRYLVQKKVAVILSTLTPSWLTDHWVGVFVSLPYLAKLIELQTIIPWVMLHANFEASERILLPTPDSWDPFMGFVATKRVVLLTGGVGAGKSTAMISALRARYPQYRVVLLMPTNALVTGYVNDFIARTDVRLVHRGDQTDIPFEEKVIVMTNAQLWRRCHQLTMRSTIVIFDEAHVVSHDSFMSVDASEDAPLRIFSSATPVGALFDRFHEAPLFIQPNREVAWGPRTREVVAGVDAETIDAAMTEGFKRLAAKGLKPDDAMFYHPSIRTLNKWASGASSYGAPIRYITADQYGADTKAATFVTGVVLQGANIKPAPSALLMVPVKLGLEHALVTDEDNSQVVKVTFSQLATLTRLVQVPLSTPELVQLEGRVGREKAGHVIVLMPGQQYPALENQRKYVVVCIPSGGGKSTLKQAHPDLMLDIDELLPWKKATFNAPKDGWDNVVDAANNFSRQYLREEVLSFQKVLLTWAPESLPPTILAKSDVYCVVTPPTYVRANRSHRTHLENLLSSGASGKVCAFNELEETVLGYLRDGLERNRIAGQVSEYAGFGVDIGPPTLVLGELHMMEAPSRDSLLARYRTPRGFADLFRREKFLGLYVRAENTSTSPAPPEEGAMFICLYLLLGQWEHINAAYAIPAHSQSSDDAIKNASMILRSYGLAVPPLTSLFRQYNAFRNHWAFPYAGQARRGVLPVVAGARIVLYQC